WRRPRRGGRRAAGGRHRDADPRPLRTTPPGGWQRRQRRPHPGRLQPAVHRRPGQGDGRRRPRRDAVRPPEGRHRDAPGRLLAARYDLVRCGITVYGIPPAPALSGRLPLRPALGLRAQVSHVRRLAAGERLSYGLRYELTAPSTVVTVPVGYADGVPRRLGEV